MYLNLHSCEPLSTSLPDERRAHGGQIGSEAHGSGIISAVAPFCECRLDEALLEPRPFPLRRRDVVELVRGTGVLDSHHDVEERAKKETLASRFSSFA